MTYWFWYKKQTLRSILYERKVILLCLSLCVLFYHVFFLVLFSSLFDLFMWEIKVLFIIFTHHIVVYTWCLYLKIKQKSNLTKKLYLLFWKSFLDEYLISECQKVQKQQLKNVKIVDKLVRWLMISYFSWIDWFSMLLRSGMVFDQSWCTFMWWML